MTTPIAEIQKTKAAIPIAKKMTGEVRLVTRSISLHRRVPTASLAALGEGRSYPTERERAVRASLLGALLGLMLALFARVRRAG